LLYVTHHSPTPCAVNITEMLAEMLGEYKAAMPGISFALNAEPSLTCYAVEQYLRLVFSNLLKNAVEAAETQGYVTVYATRVGGYLHTAIHNNGNFSEMPQQKPHGNGMGLGICYWLLEQLDGELQIKNDASGGCVTTVSLPCGM